MAVAKVFSISLTGGPSVKKDVDDLKKSMISLGAEIAKTKTQLSSLLSGTQDTKAITTLNQKLDEQQSKLSSLAETRGALERDAQAQASLQTTLANNTNTTASAFSALNTQVKESKLNAQEMAAQFGVESEQAKAATASFTAYKLQLAEINNLIKTGGTPAAAAPVPFTTNIAELEAEQAALVTTGIAVNDLEKEQIEATIEANNWAASQKTATEAVKQTAVEVAPMTLKYDQFTSTLRNNITAQLENEQALIANRAAQKELSAVLAESGAASGAAFDKLAALREEELLLVESNKALSVTVRNQAKEFISAGGSVDEMQAQLNQLQQTFEQLSETERASPFGQSLKAEIDILEPKVKQFEAEIGKFSRNVGNYPQGYKDAFSVLNQELDKTRAKIVQGNFIGPELDQLTAKEKILADTTAVLGKNYSSSTAQSNAFKEATRQMALTFGSGSQVFKDFTAQVKAGNTELKATDKAITAQTGSGGAFQKLYGGLRQLANILPGIGISGLILLLLDPLTSLGSKLFDVAKGAGAASKATRDLEQAYTDTQAAVEGSSQEFVGAVQNVETLRINIDLARKGLLDKNEVLKQYNDTIGKTTGKVTDLDQAEQALTKNADAYIKFTLLKAAANIALEGAAKKAFEAEVSRQKRTSDFQTIGSDVTAFGAGQTTATGFVPSLSDPNVGLKARSDAAKKAQDKTVKDAKDESDSLINIAKSFQTQAAQIATDMGFDFFGGKETTKPKKSRISVDEAEALKNIEANRLRLLAIENTSVNEIEKVRKLSFDEEEQHLRNVEKINVDAFDAKIALFQKNKNQNAEEKKQLAEFGEQKSQIELDTSKKIQDIEKKRFEEQSRTLEAEATLQIAQIKQANDLVQNDPTLNNVQKAQAFIDSDKQILAIEQDFYNKLSKLNSDFNKDALIKAKAGIVNIMKELQKEVRALGPATLKDIGDTTTKAITDVQTVLAQKTIDILNANLSPTETAKKITAIQKEAQILVLANQVAGDKIALEQQKKLLDQKLISEKEFQEALKKLKTDEAALDQLVTNAQLNNLQKLTLAFKEFGATLLENLLGIKQYTNDASGQAARIQDVIRETQTTIKNAVNQAYESYFKNQSDQIDRDTKAQESFLDRQRQQVLATAQSQAEQDTINRQYDQKKLDADRKAFNEKKKLALKQATIDFALAEIKTFATYGWPLGLILGAGLAIAYGLQRAAINAQQFAKGGQVKNLSSGKITGAPNISMANGDNMLATVRTGEVILNQRHQAALGGARTFAAIGVPGFASSGQLGTSLRAPSFNASGVNSADISRASQDFDDLKIMVSTIASAVYATDTKPVILVPDKVTRAQSRTRKDVSIATI